LRTDDCGDGQALEESTCECTDAIRMKLSFADLSLEEFLESDAMQQELIAGVAAHLGLGSTHQVRIVSIAAGSVIVDMAVLPPPEQAEKLADYDEALSELAAADGDASSAFRLPPERFGEVALVEIETPALRNSDGSDAARKKAAPASTAAWAVPVAMAFCGLAFAGVLVWRRRRLATEQREKNTELIIREPAASGAHSPPTFNIRDRVGSTATVSINPLHTNH